MRDIASCVGQADDIVGLTDVEWSQQQRVNEGEDTRAGPDTYAEHRNRDGGEVGATDQCPDGTAQIQNPAAHFKGSVMGPLAASARGRASCVRSRHPIGGIRVGLPYARIHAEVVAPMDGVAREPGFHSTDRLPQ